MLRLFLKCWKKISTRLNEEDAPYREGKDAAAAAWIRHIEVSGIGLKSCPVLNLDRESCLKKVMMVEEGAPQ